MTTTPQPIVAAATRFDTETKDGSGAQSRSPHPEKIPTKEPYMKEGTRGG